MSTSPISFDVDSSEGMGAFLRPVYFNRHVLVKYMYDPRIQVEFASETYGTIYAEEWHLSFGINSKNSVIAWQGDLQNLPVVDQYHWRSENIPSQRDVASDFYDAQISAEFTEPPIGVQALNAIAKWNTAFALKYGAPLYKARDLEERLHDVRRYRKLIINREEDFITYISELNEIINEAVDNSSVRSVLAEKAIAVPSGTKGNKLLELVYTKILGDSANLIAPFFYLYDLRLWADHNMGEEKLITVSASLGVADPSNFEELMTALLSRLLTSATTLADAYG